MYLIGTDLPPALFRRISPNETLEESREVAEMIALVAISNAVDMIGYRLLTVNPFLLNVFGFQETYQIIVMKRCAAVKKKGSTQQCEAKAIFGHTLCGRHAKMKKPVLWAEYHKKPAIVRFQALVRGWLVRHYLRLCGPGVLQRKNLVNDEDLATFEDKDKQYPMDYFSIEENGKVWWFDFDTICKWTMQNLHPTNPYSKTELSMNDRRRLREVWGYRQRHQMVLPKDSSIHEERIRCRWNLLCQTFEEFGFSDIHPRMFDNMAKINYYTMFQFINDDVRVSVSDKAHYKERIVRLCSNAIRSVRELDSRRYMGYSLLTLMLMISKPKDPYILVFTILSALHRC